MSKFARSLSGPRRKNDVWNENSAAVFILLFIGCPPAITRCVVAVVIDTVNRFAFWFNAHIGKKVFKSVPSLANLDAAPAVVAIAFVPRVSTPIKHVAPYFVRWSANAVLAVTVAWLGVMFEILDCYFSLKTPARPCMIVCEIKAVNFDELSAGAFTQPSWFPFNSVSNATNDR